MVLHGHAHGIAFLTPAGQRQRGPFARQRMVGRGRNHRENRASGHPDGLAIGDCGVS